MRNTEVTAWKYTVKSTVHATWNVENAISVCWCQNRLTYVMVLLQIPTLLHSEQFILQKTTYIFCHIVLQASISVTFQWLAFKICWRRVTRIFFMDNFDLVLLNKLTLLSILRSFVHINVPKLLWRKHFLKRIYCLSNCY